MVQLSDRKEKSPLAIFYESECTTHGMVCDCLFHDQFWRVG